MNEQRYSRRLVMRMAMAAAAAGVASPLRAQERPARVDFINDPFSLGVASGDPTPDGAVLWTRLAPSPLDGAGGMPPQPVTVLFEVATDERFSRIVKSGRVVTGPESAHAVHVELSGMPAGQSYYYRFHAGSATSPVGRFATAAAYGSRIDHLRLAWASCQHYEQGFFTPYQDMVAQDPDLIIHTGDYIYESSWGPQVRRQVVPEPYTLEDYRRLHAQYKLDPDLQAAHRAAPWLFIWDDHEVDNDYAGNVGEEADVSIEDFFRRRVAAYSAYFEHQPLRRRSAVTPEGTMRIWGQSTFGDLASVFLTDGRQFRSPLACPTATDRGGRLVPASCGDLADEARTYLGARQEQWLQRSFGQGPATWNLLVQPTLFSPFRGGVIDDEPVVWSDGWDGYPAARERLTQVLARRDNANPIVLGGDTHCYWVADVKTDYRDEAAKPVGAEFVTTSITSLRGGYEQISALLPENPHIKHFDNREHGYGLVDLYRDRAEVDLRVVETPRTRGGSAAHSQAKFVVEAGNPGVRAA
ncbi:MAG: alkaline phosphatase D family protein [Halieaceae bacterium]|jgi:alkaline phosphatase D|nr:alkaline phosphatase D family protein [Halieaceae bacterium]